jgi:hypothetical protein
MRHLHSGVTAGETALTKDFMMKTTLSLEQACYSAVHDYPGGVGAVAATYGLVSSTLQNKLNPTQATHKLNASEVEQILELTKDPRILDAMCARVGAVWLDLGSMGGGSDMAMLDNITTLVTRVGELSTKVQNSLEDGRVDASELKGLETAVLRLNQSSFYVLERAKQFM